MSLSAQTVAWLSANMGVGIASELATALNAGNAALPLAGGTLTDGANVVLGTTTGTQIGTGATQKLGFLGATPIVQRSGAAQAAVATTASTNSTPYGYAQSQADAIVTLVNELRAAMVAVGLIKGAA